MPILILPEVVTNFNQFSFVDDNEFYPGSFSLSRVLRQNVSVVEIDFFLHKYTSLLDDLSNGSLRCTLSMLFYGL